MKLINSIEINPVSFPLNKSFSNHVRTVTHLNGLVIQLITNMNIIGYGFIYGLSNIPYPKIIKYIEDDLFPALLKCDSLSENMDQFKKNWEQFWNIYKNTEYEKSYALAAIDITVWDLFTKSNNTSLYRYLGAAQSKIPVYGTTGWLSLSLQELIEECEYYANKGIRAFKVRLGHEDDYLRIKSLREKMGDDFVLMLDANQRYSVEEAIQVSKNLAKFNITWIEEPTNNALNNIEEIKKYSKIPLALGESIFLEEIFQTICDKQLTNYLQPDVPRCGGITGFHKISKMAEKYKLPLCNHLTYELSTSLIAGSSSGYVLEYDNLLSPDIFTESFSIKDGYIQPPDVAGTGVTLKNESLKKHSIDFYSFK